MQERDEGPLRKLPTWMRLDADTLGVYLVSNNGPTRARGQGLGASSHPLVIETAHFSIRTTEPRRLLCQIPVPFDALSSCMAVARAYTCSTRSDQSRRGDVIILLAGQ